ncbi:MAG: hypothetical protein IJH47_04765 [Oscillospiraceae bacterium]|nr:hypothetical protein [Oscillospiraceae bacterium]
MTMEAAVKSVFGPMGPTPGAEERIWKAIDKGLPGRAKAAEVRFRPRRAKKPLLIGAAAILALVLLTAAVIRHMPAERPESIHPADEAEEPSPEAEEPVLIPTVRQIALINARVDGKEILDLTEEGRYLARAVLPEGYTVDHWEVNGEPVDAGGRLYSLEFDSEGVWKVEAVLREERRVTCVNAYLQFVDEDGQPAGWMYEDVCFEYDYTVPTTGERHPGGTITARVLPIDPEEYEPYYWLIDGEKYWNGENGTPPGEIILDNLDHSVQIELVYRHGYRNRELSQAVVLGEGGETPALPQRPADDVPENERPAPEETWREVDYVRDGVPIDPEAPGRDGHTHDWVVDEENSVESTCTSTGVRRYVCSICGWHYRMWLEKKPHQYDMWLTYRNGHAKVCSVCWTWKSPYHTLDPHVWVTEGDRVYCKYCGYVYGS